MPARDPDPTALSQLHTEPVPSTTSPSGQALPSTSLLPPWKCRGAAWEAFPFTIPKGEKFGGSEPVDLLEAGAL